MIFVFVSFPQGDPLWSARLLHTNPQCIRDAHRRSVPGFGARNRFTSAENRFKVMWFLSPGSSSAAPTSSRQLRTRRVSKASSATWTWALRAPESCWCPEFNWPKRRCRDFCPTVVPQVQKTLKRTGFYFSGVWDKTPQIKEPSDITAPLSLQVREHPWLRLLSDHMGRICTMAPSTPGTMQRRWVSK